MTIEIHSGELETVLRQRMAGGNFANIEDLLLETFLHQPARSDAELDRQVRAASAPARLQELRKGVTLDRPAGVSLREYAHIGHRY